MTTVDASTVVARREVADLDHPDLEVRRLALATLAQAVHELLLADPAAREVPPRLTLSGGRLVERYRS